MSREYNKKIVLSDGAEFYGVGFGADGEKIVEIVFNTSMVGSGDPVRPILHRSGRGDDLSADRQLRYVRR